MTDLSVIIVNYNSRYFLQLCLDSLALALNDINAETIVVDNCSNDDSVSVIKQEYAWVKLIENEENFGFGRANNQGIKIAKGQYILLLNPDTIVQKNTLKHCINTLSSQQDIGAIGVKMLDGSGHFLPESKRGLPHPRTAFFKAFGFAKLFPHSSFFAHYYLGHLPQDQASQVEVLAGAFMMCKADVLHKCKGFDEDFFMYGEDIDLSYRITQLGYSNYYLPQYPIIHFKGESAKRDAVWASHFYGAMQMFSKKHFSKKGAFFNWLINFGIKIKKRSAVRNTAAIQHNTDVTNLNLLVITSMKSIDSKLMSLVEKFKSYNIHSVKNQIPTSHDAILFLPDVPKEKVIRIISENEGKSQFFFAGNDFILTSPDSSSKGEILQ